jgi:hypothetical protein
MKNNNGSPPNASTAAEFQANGAPALTGDQLLNKTADDRNENTSATDDRATRGPARSSARTSTLAARRSSPPPMSAKQQGSYDGLGYGTGNDRAIAITR